MDLSIVIVSWNTAELVRQCLKSIPRACGPLQVEVFVVDNNSKDATVEMLRSEFSWVQLIASPSNLGFAAGNNLALPRASGDFVLLLNPDTVCPPDSLERLVYFAKLRPRLGVAGPLLTTGDGSPTITWGRFPRPTYHWREALDPLRVIPGLRARMVHVPRRTEPSRRVDYVAGACFLMPRAALQSVGLLDDRFFLYFEETDWCWRARQLGLEVWYCADTEVVHLESQSADQVSAFSRRQMQKSYRQFIAKNYGEQRMWEFRLAQFTEYISKALRRLLAPGNRARNRKLAAVNWDRARLQLQRRIDVAPPA